MAKMSSSWLLMVFVILALALMNTEGATNSTVPSPTADVSRNTTKNVLDGFFQNLLKMIEAQNRTTNRSPNNITKRLDNFLTNLDVPKMISDIFLKPNSGNPNAFNDILERLLPNVSLPDWSTSSKMDILDMYRAITGLFAPQNATGLGAMVSRLMPFVKLYTPTLMAWVTHGLQGMNISEPCTQHTTAILSGILEGKLWALQYLDAIGKPKSGLIEGALYWPGNFHECVNIQSPATEESVKGNYCLLKIPLPMSLLKGLSDAGKDKGNIQTDGIAAAVYASFLSLQYGLCVPNSCSVQDVTSMINQGPMKLLPKSLYGYPPVIPEPVCHHEQDISKDTRAIVVSCVLGGIGFVILLGTLYDVVTLLLWKYKDRCATKTNFTKTNGVKMANVVSNGNGYVQMPDDMENGTIKKTCADIYVVGGTEAGKQTNLEAEVTQDKLSEKDNHKSVVKQEPRPKPGIIGGLLMAFSVYTNTKKLVNTEQRSGTLSSVNGVRFFSMTWVVLGHTFIFHMGIADNILGYARDFQARWTSQALLNALVSVDSFFTLSGLLVSYLTLNEMRKAKSAKINWFMFYFHRFWRLTPPYMLIIMTYVPLYQYWGQGPQWPVGQMEPMPCNIYWWKNLIYINNFNMTDSCIGWSWYLANDMQFYVISPLILIPLFYSKILGMIILGLFFLATFITTGVLSYVNNFQPGVDSRPDFMEKIYIKPWCRIGPYLVGIFVGYVLYRTRCKVKLHASTVILGWCSAAVVCLAVLYGLYGHTHGHPLSVEASAVYNALHRTAWGAGLGWVVFACCTGYGGIVNSFLSWKAFVPLARLTYMVYLIHLIVMYYFNTTSIGPIYASDVTMSYLFLGNLIFSYGAAVILSLAFEAPMMGLEKVIFRRK
ncbi:O-acyltransferase like protein-like [Liolophura sinensis]|uniref:O-acyltransferase like protein-like n=1 Tax=Liolophura sinensis TaxID=3198878 RepID=UPI003159897A